jgi:hypothetical protein
MLVMDISLEKLFFLANFTGYPYHRLRYEQGVQNHE